MNALRKPQAEAPTDHPTPTALAPLRASQEVDSRGDTLRDAHRHDHLVERCACGAWAWTPAGCGTCIALAARLLTDRAGGSLEARRRDRAAHLADRLHATAMWGKVRTDLAVHRRATGAA